MKFSLAPFAAGGKAVLALVCLLGADGALLNVSQIGALQQFAGSWTGNWEMPSWTCMDPRRPQVSTSAGLDYPIALCCVDDLADPLISLTAVSFLEWRGEWRFELKTLAPFRRQAFDTGMIPWPPWAGVGSQHRTIKGEADAAGCLEQSGACTPDCAQDLEEHAVRCCRSEALEGWHNPYCSAVYVQREQECLELPWRDAELYCESIDARLCSRDELENNCAKQTDCDFNQRLIWVQEACGTTAENCTNDLQPSTTIENPTCAAQRSNTDLCEARRNGSLADGLCQKTCEVCGACEDSLTFYDEWTGYNGWPGTCEAWAASVADGGDCLLAADWSGYTQAGEDAVVANCPRACRLCASEEATLYTIIDFREHGLGYKMKAVNSFGASLCAYVEANKTAMGSVFMSLASRSEIYDYYWHELFDCDDEVDLSEGTDIQGCNQSEVWPEDFYDVFVGLVDGSVDNAYPNRMMSTWRRSASTLFPAGTEIITTTTTFTTRVLIVAGESEDPSFFPVVVACVIVLSGICAAVCFVLSYRRRQRMKKQAAIETEKKKIAEDLGLENDGWDGFLNFAPGVQKDESLSDPAKSDFKQSDYQDVLELGITEHWLILPRDLLFEQLKIGEGSFGDVCKAKLCGATEVVVKLARNGLRSREDAQSRQALANELRLLRRVRHPNIVLFHGATIVKREDNLVLCLVLEWVQGQDFRMYLKKRKENGSLKEDLRKSKNSHLAEHRIMSDTALAMQYLHAQHPPILHRDLKPANILIDMTIKPHRAKIADFGLSAVLERSDLSARVGTLNYMAPEVKLRSNYRTPADVFSFGCILGAILHTARSVQRSDQGDAEMEKRATKDKYSIETLPSPSEVGMPFQGLLALAKQCLWEQPDKRISFSEVHKQLAVGAGACGAAGEAESSRDATSTGGETLGPEGTCTEQSGTLDSYAPHASAGGSGLDRASPVGGSEISIKMNL